MRFCAILSAKISLLPPRIARNGLISETGSLLTAPSSGESGANLIFWGESRVARMGARLRRDNARGGIVSVSLSFGQSARSASILVVDDEPDVADLFRQHFRREARQGTYVMHFAASGGGGVGSTRWGDPAHASDSPLGHQHARNGRPAIIGRDQAKIPGSAGHDGDRLWRRRQPNEPEDIAEPTCI